jgi:hypothetical protein
MRILVGVLVLLVACVRESPEPFPSKRPADFALEVIETGGVMGMHETFVIAGDRLTRTGRSSAHDVELTESELDAVYQATREISRVHDRPHHGAEIADDIYVSMVATGAGARYEVPQDREGRDVMNLVRMLVTFEHAR